MTATDNRSREQVVDDISSVDIVLDDIARGRPVLLLTDEDDTVRAQMIFAADRTNAELVAFMVRHTTGLIRVPLRGDRCDRLDLPLMMHNNQHPHRAAYTVTVDAAKGVTTGISARDRARTIHVLADPNSAHNDLTRPGHLLPLRAVPGGVLERPRHTEAAVDLVRLAGLEPVAVMCELVSVRDPRHLPGVDEVSYFAARHGLHAVRLDSLVHHQRRTQFGIAVR
jgi:3,4-dihydroxy 2-butanone 4-phosphate synthase / GTP cyclohydrolase II